MYIRDAEAVSDGFGDVFPELPKAGFETDGTGTMAHNEARSASEHAEGPCPVVLVSARSAVGSDDSGRFRATTAPPMTVRRTWPTRTTRTASAPKRTTSSNR